jgi:hypothetical protein
MGEISPESFAVESAVRLANYAIDKIKGTFDKRNASRELENSLIYAQRAFRDCVPKGMTVDSAILSAFFGGQAFESQYQQVLEGRDPDLTSLLDAFHKAGYTPGSVPGFNPLLAIAEFFRKFALSVGRKRIFANVGALQTSYDNYRRKYRYCDQLVAAYENLSFAGVPGAFDQNPVKLEDIFITLQASHRIPEVDILTEEGELPEPVEQRRPPRDLRMREAVKVLSVMEALKDNSKMVILGAPGSGKTTFMRYLWKYW